MPDPKKVTSPGYRAPALERGLEILECLAENSPLTQTEIARCLGRAVGEVFRMLQVLERRGYLQKDVHSGAYQLTLRLFCLSRSHTPARPLLDAAAGPMRRLVAECRESCHLSLLSGDRLLSIAEEQGKHPVRITVETGATFPLLRTASGRLLLASMPESRRDLILADLPEFAEMTAEARRQLLDTFEKLRTQQYVQAYGETIGGVYDLAVLVGVPDGALQAALTVACLTTAPKTARLRLLEPLRRAAAEITQNAGLAPLAAMAAGRR